MRLVAFTAVVLVASSPAIAALASEAPANSAAPIPAAAVAHYSVDGTNIGTMLEDPAAKAVIDKHLPGFSKRDEISMVRSMTLKAIQRYAPDKITDQVLADIQVDLSQLPAKN